MELALVWGLAGVLSGVYMMAVAWFEALRRDLRPRFWGSWRTLSEGFPNIWRFVTITNADVMISTVMNRGLILVVGAILGTTGASLFQIAWQSTDFMRTASTLLSPIFFPELAQMEVKGKRSQIRDLIKRTLQFAVIWLGLMSVILLFGTEPYLFYVFGPETVAVTNAMILFGIAAALHVSGFTFEPALMSIGREGALLTTHSLLSLLPSLRLLL